jgi:hypothetical protein
MICIYLTTLLSYQTVPAHDKSVLPYPNEKELTHTSVITYNSDGNVFDI